MKNITTKLQVQDLIVEVIQKDIKNLHLRIYPPEGQVQVSAPKGVSQEFIRIFVLSKREWIYHQQEKLRAREADIPLEYINGEQYYFRGKELVLEVIESKAAPFVLVHDQTLELHIRPDSSVEKRKAVIENWYRSQLKKQIPIFIDKYEKLMQLNVSEFGVKKMRTRWGTCNPRAKRIWLNLELSKKPLECSEYVVLHEMTHFLESKHNKRFYSFLDRYMPKWKAAEKQLS